MAVTSLDAWIVNVNARLSAREIDGIRTHSGARLVLYMTHVSPEAVAHAARHGATAMDLQGWGAIQISGIDSNASPETVPADPRARVAALIYTSGTTGDPKGVMLTHNNLLYIGGVSGRLRGLERADRVYGVLPISHVYGLASVCLGTLTAGACLHLQGRYTPQAMEAALSRQGITVMQGVPAMYAKLLEHLGAQGRAFQAPKLRFLYAGGSPLDPALKRDVEAASGMTLHNGYGLTESSPTVTQTRHEEPRADCSVGRPLPGLEIRMVDACGNDVPSGEPGELWVRGPNVMKGYYRNPELTSATVDTEGWLNTGDIARQDADGAVFIVGRTKELIIRSGFNVYPVEVEAVLNSHPEVTQSAVVGRAVEGNEEVVAFVELIPGARVTPQALQEFAAQSLAAYKRPAEVVVLPALPAAANGKVLKHKLKELAHRTAQAA
jgi:long-chain acyl-CoA synthetase